MIKDEVLKLFYEKGYYKNPDDEKSKVSKYLKELQETGHIQLKMSFYQDYPVWILTKKGFDIIDEWLESKNAFAQKFSKTDAIHKIKLLSNWMCEKKLNTHS